MVTDSRRIKRLVPPSAMPRLMQALWNQRLAGLFILSPALGVVLVELIFGLSQDLQLMAAGMLILSIALFGILLGGEYRALRDRRSGR